MNLKAIMLRERRLTKNNTGYIIRFHLYKVLEVKKKESMVGKKTEQWLPHGVGDRDWLWRDMRKTSGGVASLSILLGVWVTQMYASDKTQWKQA